MNIFKHTLVRTVSISGLGLCAWTHAAAANEVPGVDESNAYRLQMMTQIFDGQRDFSQAQVAKVGRVRKGNESYTLMNFGDGSVFIETRGNTSAGNFKNTSGVEAEFKYNYATKTLSGANQVAKYFNTHVRQYLQGSPALGRDTTWTKNIAIRDMDIAGASGGQINIELTRDYFSYGGKDFVLLHYKLPAFSYTSADGERVIQWGEGVSVSDPGFGEIYWNASLQRAVATGADGVQRPYRYAKTIAATDAKGAPLIDPRKMDAVKPYFDTFYGETKTQVIGFVGGGHKPDQTPIRMAANLDVMALSLAEGSANESPQISGQYTGGSNGNARNARRNPIGSRVGTLSIDNRVLTGLGLADKYVAVLNAIETYNNAPVKDYVGALDAYTNALKELATESDRLKRQFVTLKEKNDFLRDIVDGAIKNTPDGQFVNDRVRRVLEETKQNSAKLKVLAKEIEVLGGETNKIGNILKKMPVEKVSKVMDAFGKSMGGKALAAFSHAMNIKTTYDAGRNIYTAATSDQSTGELKLTRNYGTSDSGFVLGLDLIGLAANAYSGDPVAVFSDAIAITSGSLGDVYISAKGKLDTDAYVIETYKEGSRLRIRLNNMKQDKYIREYTDLVQKGKDAVIGLNEHLDQYDLTPKPWTVYHPNWDPMTNDWRVGSRQWNEKQALLTRERNGGKVDWDAVNQRFYDAFKKDYPTAAKRTPPPTTSAEKYVFVGSATPDWLLEQWERDARQREARGDLDAYQKRRLQEIREEQRLRDEERRQRIEYGKNNPITFDPVTFDPVTWDPPVWEPPEWVPPVWTPPEFDAPDSSIIDFTQFSGSEDDNWLGFASVMAYQYGDLSGTVATDLGPYEAFIAKYGMRKLERLALQAGYPNLASALNDWQNLVAKANDSGFRQWANRAPVCYMACANIQGLWTQKKSQLALGDLLADSRNLFSTGGLTDVSIGSLLLTIFFRDFGLQDNDAIRIIVTQFGREIFNSSFVLTNAGQSINIALRPGIAAVQVTALNTGDIPPNTAEVRIDGVIEGDSEQRYSLDKGEQAVLRVNTGRP